MPRRRPPLTAPVADRRPHMVTHHGVELVDEYAWLRASNWSEVIETPDTLPADIAQHLADENAYADDVLATTSKLRRTLMKELRARHTDDTGAVADCDGPWAYYTRMAKNADHACFCRRPRDGGPETLILDAERLSRRTVYFDIMDTRHSPDHRLFAYAADTTGAERFTIRFRDIASGRELADAIPDAAGYFAWSADSAQVFYVRLDASHRPLLVYRHAIGTPVAEDALIYAEADPAFDVAVTATGSGDIVIIDIDAHHADESWLIDAHVPEAPPRLIAPRANGHQYDVDVLGDELFITTTSGEAADYRICVTPLATPGPEHWREIVPHVPGRRILDMRVLSRHLVWLERRDGLQRIVVRRHADGRESVIGFDEPSYDIDLESTFEQDTNVMRYSYQSMITPPQTWEFDLDTGERTLLHRDEPGAGYDPSRYVMERVELPSHDGVFVPVTLLRSRSFARDGTAPLLLEGYGGYGDALEADFASERMLLVDRGFVYALAHVRGGEEKGFEWHAHGRHFHKPNSPKDFVAVAEQLAARGYTSPGRIVARGESAGGMLVAAAANLRPELFLAILANVPFVDVLNTMLDATLPLTPGEWPEWGNPLESASDFELIRSYCPYQNVRPTRYPHVLARTSLGDQRVGYWEPAKWIARLRERAGPGSFFLLTTDMEGGGHDGAAGRSGSIEEIAQEFAYILSLADAQPSY